jgi:predicted nucleic acid-binding Zn ribbon protein
MARASRRRDRSVPTHAAELVRGVLRRYGVESAVREHRIVTEWTTIVGDRVAARAWPDGLKNGVLFVRVTNSAWLHELGFLREAIARAANQTVGRTIVREVHLHLGRRRASPDADDVVAALAAQRRPRPAPRAPRAADDELRAMVADVQRRLGS